MKCQKCGRELNANEKFCQNCGQKVYVQPQQIHPNSYPQAMNNNFNSMKPVKQKKRLSTGAIVGITLCSILAFFVLIFIIMFTIALASPSSDSTSSSSESKKIDPRTVQEEKWQSYYEENIDAKEISISELHDYSDDYVDEYILTVDQIDDLREDYFTTDTQHDSIILDGIKFEFAQYGDELKYYSEKAYVIVYGRVNNDYSSWSDVLVTDCHIMASGSEAVNKAKELNEKDYQHATIAPTTVISDDDRKKQEEKWSNEFKNVDAIEVDINTLHDNIEEYEGKTILTVAKITSKESDSFNASTQHENSFFYGTEFYFKQYSDQLKYYENGDLVIVYGTVDNDVSSWSDVSIVDCHIIGSGDEAKEKVQTLR